MVERARRLVSGSKEETEEYFSNVQVLTDSGTVKKIPFDEIDGIKFIEEEMQKQFEASLLAAVDQRMPKAPPPPVDNREAVSVRAVRAPDGQSSDSEALCKVSYV